MSQITTRNDGPGLLLRDIEGSRIAPFKERDRLCHICRNIDFECYKYRELQKDIAFGTTGQVRSRHWCPFCRLVKNCLSVESSPRLQDDEEIWLTNGPCWKLSIEASPYDPNRSEATSNKFDLRKHAKELEDVAHRFIVNGTQVDGTVRMLGQIQYLASPSLEWEERQFLGRRVDPAMLEIEPLIECLKKCKEHHNKACSESDVPRSRLPRGFRLIDVRTRAIVEAPDEAEYFVLSYVWGEEEMMAMTGMRPVLLQRSWLKDNTAPRSIPLPARLPKTIEDAIRLTKDMGCCYLWVDALCIFQDDDDHSKHPHLSRMDAVYACATLTIAAGSGRHADRGLPGLYGTRRSKQQVIESIDRHEMSPLLPTYTQIENSRALPWNLRGWTLQEKLLSLRILLFTESQVYFKCSEAISSEQSWIDVSHIVKNTQALAMKYRWSSVHLSKPMQAKSYGTKFMQWLGYDTGSTWMESFIFAAKSQRDAGFKDFYEPEAMMRECTQRAWFKSYTSAVQECTQRALRDPNDLFFSIDGILKLLGSGPGGFFWGLPCTEFAKSMLWRPGIGAQITTRSSVCPSWSWASWHFDQQGVSYHRPDNKALFTMWQHRSMLAQIESRSHQTSASASKSQKNDDTAKVPTFLDVNMQSCLAFWPGLVPRPKYIFFCANGKVHPVSKSAMKIEKYKDDVEKWFPNAKSLSYRLPSLLLDTPLVQFHIGRPLKTVADAQDSSTGLYELVDDRGRCVGEAWTTRKVSRAYRSKPLDCLTISRTWNFEHARVHDKYVPRWKFNSMADSIKAARMKPDEGGIEAMTQVKAEMMLKPLRALDLFREVRSGERKTHGIVDSVLQEFLERELDPDLDETSARSSGWKNMGGLTRSIVNLVKAFEETQEPSKQDRSYLEDHRDTPFLNVVFALKGQTLPQFLWKVVEVVLVQWEGDIAWRVGTGRIAYNAWKEALPVPQRVILV